MFPEPTAPLIQISNHHSSWVGGKPVYIEYRPKRRAQCDECIWIVHERRLATGQMGDTLIGTARHKRTNGNGAMLLCESHYQLWRILDGKV